MSGSHDHGQHEHDVGGHDHDASEHEHDSGGHDHASGSAPGNRLLGWVRHLLAPHSHDANDRIDAAFEATDDGTRTLLYSLGALLLTAGVQAVVVVFSGSVALLGDAAHNFGDALTALPLLAAFALARRPPTDRFPHGLGRVEDLAGVAVVVMIAASAAVSAAVAVERLVRPRTVHHLPWVAAAAAIGFAGNELVAQYRISTGRRIGSAALVADGLHARADGLTSLAVLVGALGVALGWKQADPIVGLAISGAIVAALVSAIRQVGGRLLDAVSPGVGEALRHELAHTPGVLQIGAIRSRWVGHRLHVDAEIGVDPAHTVAAGHDIAEEARHRLFHAEPRLAHVVMHVDPWHADGPDPHDALAHHER